MVVGEECADALPWLASTIYQPNHGPPLGCSLPFVSIPATLRSLDMSAVRHAGGWLLDEVDWQQQQQQASRASRAIRKYEGLVQSGHPDFGCVGGVGAQAWARVEFSILLLPHEPSGILPLQGNGSGPAPEFKPCFGCTAQAVILPFGKVASTWEGP